jgi:hypothetical protein
MSVRPVCNCFPSPHFFFISIILGLGLGATNQGRTDPIRAQLKFDTMGVGHDRAEEFTSSWWEVNFNKAAKNITVSEMTI